MADVTDFQIQGDVLRLLARDRLLLTFRTDPSGSKGTTAEASVTGTVIYRQRIALTNDAVVEVKLVDVSRADAPAVTIAEQSIKTQGRQVPIDFKVTYDQQRIDRRRSYAIQVRILEGDQLRFINTQAYLVLTHGHSNKVDVLVTAVQ